MENDEAAALNDTDTDTESGDGMAISREEAVGLRAGDLVTLRSEKDPLVVTMGPLRAATAADRTPPVGELYLGDEPVRWAPSNVRYSILDRLTVIWRGSGPVAAARPAYVNSTRLTSRPGDIVRGADEPDSGRRGIWLFAPVGSGAARGAWVNVSGGDAQGMRRDREDLPARLLLLVDGETGKAVTE